MNGHESDTRNQYQGPLESGQRILDGRPMNVDLSSLDLPQVDYVLDTIRYRERIETDNATDQAFEGAEIEYSFNYDAAFGSPMRDGIQYEEQVSSSQVVMPPPPPPPARSPAARQQVMTTIGSTATVATTTTLRATTARRKISIAPRPAQRQIAIAKAPATTSLTLTGSSSRTAQATGNQLFAKIPRQSSFTLPSQRHTQFSQSSSSIPRSIEFSAQPASTTIATSAADPSSRMSISVAHYQPIESRHSAMNNEIYARSVDFTPSDYIAAPAEWSTHPQQPAQESYYFQESHNAHAHFDRHHHHQPSNQLQQQRYQHHHEQQQQDHPMTRDVSHSMSPSYSQSQSPQYHEPVQDSVMFGHTNEYPSTASLSASPTMVHTHFGDSTSSMLAMSASNLASWQANYSQESQGSISHERKSVNNNEYVYRPRQPLSPETMSFSPLESEATTLMSSITPTPISGQSPGNSSSSSKATAGTSTPTKAGTKAAASATKARRASTAVAKSTAKATGVKASRSKSIATTSAAATLAAAAVAHEQQRKRSESTSDMDDQEDMEGQDSGGEGGEGISDKKRQHYLERNRLAASKSRDKKRKQTARLMENSALITSRNQELHQTLDSLQDEVRALKNQILCHRGCDCMALQEYIQNSVGAPPPSTQPSLMSTSAMVMSLPMSMSPTMSSQLDHHAGHDGHFHHLNQIQQHAHFDNPTQYSTSPRQSPTLGQMEL